MMLEIMRPIHYPSVIVSDTIPPNADAGPDSTLEVDQIWIFNASGSTDNNEIAEYYWSFGDGNTSNEKIASHSYGESSTYIVTLLVRDASGNADTDEITVQVMEKGESSSESWGLMSLASILIIVTTLSTLLLILWTKRFRHKDEEE
jgi:hypothetical protein